MFLFDWIWNLLEFFGEHNTDRERFCYRNLLSNLKVESLAYFSYFDINLHTSILLFSYRYLVQ